MRDIISLHNLAITANIGADCWGRTRPQPVLLTLHAYANLEPAAASDDVADSVHYGHLSAAILALQSPTHTFTDLTDLAEKIAAQALSPEFVGLTAVRVVAEAPKLLLQAQGFGVDITRPKSAAEPADRIHIKDLAISIIVGVNPPERLSKQVVITNVIFHHPPRLFPHKKVVEQLSQHIEGTTFLTLEAFVTSVARIACTMDGMDLVTVNAQKPSAVSFGRSSGVEITRDRAFFERHST